VDNLAEKFHAYTAFFEETTSSFAEVDVIFERLVARAETLVETYGDCEEDEDASGSDEAGSTQMAQLRILWRDFRDFARKYAVSITALRTELDSKIEFAETMLEGMKKG
jgi:hypothetical protein